MSTIGGIRPLIFHWDGSLWTRMPTPASAPAGTLLTSVSGTSPADVWAVGSVFVGGVVGLDAAADHETVILHWDGQRWQLVPSPDPATGPGGFLNDIRAVTAVSPDNAWAVGDYTPGTATPYHNMLLHWDGQSWTQVPTPDTADYLNVLQAVAASPDGRLWLAGISDHPSSQLQQQGTLFQFVRIPDVIGDTLSAATVTMTNAGLVPSITTAPGPACDPSTADTVIATSPPANAFAAPPVTMTVCRLPAP
jgi:hypothetical protein